MKPGPARTYRPQTPRRCARAGCGAPAAATLRFQPTRRAAVLVDLDNDGARTQGDLCVMHAAAVALPRGFELMDQRSRADGEIVLEIEVPESEPDVPSDELAEILDANTPLLRRAFGKIPRD